MQKWEYLTTFVEADTEQMDAANIYSELVDAKSLPRHSPMAMIPALNQWGEKGWELVHIQPVHIGSNHDVLMHEGGGMRRWTKTYFCVFKRPA